MTTTDLIEVRLMWEYVEVFSKNTAQEGCVIPWESAHRMATLVA